MGVGPHLDQIVRRNVMLLGQSPLGVVLLLIFGFVISALPGHKALASTQLPRRPNVKVQLTEAEQAWIAAHPEVRWGVDPDWAPFSSFDRDHRLVGIDADITRLVASRAGLRIVMVPATSWDQIYEKAKAGQVDFMSATAKTPERLAAFDYTENYGEFPVVVVTRQDAPFFTSIRDLNSLLIAAAKNHVTTLRLQQDIPSARFILTDSTEEAVNTVAHGGADACIANLAVVTRVIHLHGLANLKISGITHYEFPLHFAVRKDAPELTSILNKALATVTDDEKELIYAAHLSPDIAKARDWGLWRRRALYATMIGAGIAALMGLWNYTLIRHIRARKATESALREAQKQMEQQARELDARIRQVERLNQELRVANQDLESFSSSVSHDLRGPLRRMSSFADLLQKEAGPFLSRRHSEWLSLLVKESRRMDGIIHDLLELARLGRRDLRLQPVNMTELVRNTMDDFRPQLGHRGVDFEVGELGEVAGDPNLLHYALGNLLDNALKYTRRVPRARISVGVLSEEPGAAEATFYIQDNGCGFDMSKAERIFDPFQRLHSEKEFEGVGIGLTNVRRIIQKHGGRIWFDSTPGQGATFYFTLGRPSGMPGRQPLDEEAMAS